jgi:hypothetical protein
MLFYETIEKMSTFVESYPAMAGFSSTKPCFQRGEMELEIINKLINCSGKRQESGI